MKNSDQIETLKWIKHNHGEYETEDKTFYAHKTRDELFGNHWELHDRRYTGEEHVYHKSTFADCKCVAEQLVRYDAMMQKPFPW